MRYTKEGIERSGEIWREGLAKFSFDVVGEARLAPRYAVRRSSPVTYTHANIGQQGNSLGMFLPMSMCLRRWCSVLG